MPHDDVKHVWNRPAWAIKKENDRYWYRGKDDADRKEGLPPGMKFQEAERAFRLA